MEQKLFIKVTGREGTNGPLIKNKIYEVIEINKNELNSIYGFAARPYKVKIDSFETYSPFLGKIEILKEK